MYEYEGIVTKVIDGDTVDFLVFLGFGASMEMRLRLWRINTPEIRGGTEETKLAARDAKQWLETRCLNKRVRFKSFLDKKNKTAKDSFRRFLAEIYLIGQDKSLNDQMIELGLGVPFMRDKKG